MSNDNTANVTSADKAPANNTAATTPAKGVSAELIKKVATDNTCSKSSRMVKLYQLGITNKSEIARLLTTDPEKPVRVQFVDNVLRGKGLISSGSRLANAGEKYDYIK